MGSGGQKFIWGAKRPTRLRPRRENRSCRAATRRYTRIRSSEVVSVLFRLRISKAVRRDGRTMFFF